MSSRDPGDSCNYRGQAIGWIRQIRQPMIDTLRMYESTLRLILVWLHDHIDRREKSYVKIKKPSVQIYTITSGHGVQTTWDVVGEAWGVGGGWSGVA